MKGRLFEVVAYITRRFGAERGAGRDPEELRDELLDVGFEEEDVDRALAWLRRLRERGAAPLVKAPPASVRVPTTEEVLRLSPEARGFLLRLERAGILDARLRETVYERATHLDLPCVGLEEVRVLAALALLAQPGADERLVRCVLEGRLEDIYH